MQGVLVYNLEIFAPTFENSMVFVACGLNHKTAPLNVREKIALPTAMHE